MKNSTTVLFLREELPNGFALKPVGTAFFIGERLSDHRAIKYIVTARHVVDGARSIGSLWVRCISPDGQRKLMAECTPDSWWSHPTTDVAIAPLAIKLEDFGLRWVPIDLLADTEWTRTHDVGIGDHVVNAGLFAQRPGIERDAPLVRFGRISLVPSEEIVIPAQGHHQPRMTFSGLLVEMGAWPGQSGSPVWVYFSIDRDLFAGEKINLQIPNPRLLGIVSGHYNFRQQTGGYVEGEVDLNSGIAIVVPASAMLEVLALEAAVVFRADFIRVLAEGGYLSIRQ